MITQDKINRVALCKLKIYTKQGKTFVVFCPRIEIGNYLKNNDWHMFECAGKLFKFGEKPWKDILLN